MAVAATFQLASKYKVVTHVGSYAFTPGKTYTQTAYPLKDKNISNALANGTLVFTDSTSNSEVQSNPLVAQESADMNRLNPGVTVGATAPTPKLQLSSQFKTPMSFGPYTLQPNKVYQDANIKMNDPHILVAIARGFITFADSTSITTFLGNPIVSAKVDEAEAALGYFGTANAFGV